MADQTKTLALRLVVETQSIDKNTKNAAASLSKLEGEASKLSKGLKGLGGLFKAAAVGTLVKDLFAMADAYAAMSNEIRSSTESVQELNTVQEALITQAAQNGTTVEQAAEAYNKLHDATEGLGLSQQEVIDLGGTLTQTMLLSGQTAEQASASVGRFAAAIENGGVNLRDFKSLLKESPELIKALAAGLGKSVDELRVMAEQGKLTREVIVEGLGKAGPEVAAKMAGQVGTVTQSLKSLASSFGAMIGEFSEGAGITSGLAQIFKDLAGWFASLAKGAQEFGITFKAVIAEATIRVINFVQQSIEFLKLMYLEWQRAKVIIRSFGQASTEVYDKEIADIKNRMELNKQMRLDSVKIIREEADAARAALAAADLNKKGAVAPKVLTAEQLKTLDSFNQALTTLKQRANDAATNLEAIRIEMKSGKEAAELYKIAMQAAAAGAELAAKMKKDFEATGTKWGGAQDFAVANQTLELKNLLTEQHKTAEAWALVNAAMSGAMTDTERTNKAIDALTKAFAYLQLTAEGAALDVETFNRAIKQMQDNAAKGDNKFNDAIMNIAMSAQDAKEEIKALQMEWNAGLEASADFRAGLEADAMQRDVVNMMRERERAGAPKMTPEEEARLTKNVEEWSKLNTEAEKMKSSMSIASDALASTMTDAERAELAIAELNKSLIFLQEHGMNITPEMQARFKEATDRMRENADIVTRTWKEASMAVISTFIDFLAEGSFNVKEFVKSTVSQLSKLIIQMLVIKSIAGTGWGKWLGLADGGVMSHGRLVPMASGGIVSSPTFFPMANGGTGLMGEAGPEAVMPLARLASGKLGVSAEPQNIQVVNNTGVQASARIERTANRTSIILEAAQLGAKIAEERITRSMRSGYGATSTALQRTYALKRRG